ncbi:MAG: S-layer homology domain-containing protein [Oscillospiraceae bacterium]|nr:S-layer homology domain-containing protein [Oscillospiraceae bacterium]
MKNQKIKIKLKNRLITALAVICFLAAAIPASAGGLVNSSAGENYESYVRVSSTVGESVSVPVRSETAPLSHGLNIIRNRLELKKSALLNSDITFRPEEFEKILGVKKLGSVTITDLPRFSEGVLTLGGGDILPGQTISRENIQYIRLVPYPNRVGEISFTFRNAEDSSENSSIRCSVSVLESLNFAPAAKAITLTTQKNIPVFKSMDGTDPDNDDITYRIVQGPKKGLLEVIDVTNGHFVYRPGRDYTGKDSFVYQVEDKYGNLSNPATAQIKITKAASSVRFADMDEHWAANSAVKAAAAGFIDADKNNPGLLFEPDVLMTRAEFTEMIIRAAKLDKNMSEVFRTGFADDADIPFKYKPYVTKAYELGIIKGIETDVGLYFDPNSIIIRAEAAVMLNNILKINPDSASVRNNISDSVFVDAVFIPEWAEGDIAALSSAGIIKGDENGNVNPGGFLDRAQSVEMLNSMLEYNAEQKKPGGIFSFFFR